MADKIFKKNLRDREVSEQLPILGEPYENTGIIAPNKDSGRIYSAGQGLALLNGTFSIAQNGATNGQGLQWNGSAWLPATFGGAYYSYNAGTGAYVFATALGITYSKAGGTGTFTIPANTNLISATLHGTSADLTGNTFSVVFNGHILNTSTGTLFPPTIQKYDRLLEDTPSEALPYTYDMDNTPQIQITGVNPLRIRVINLNGIVNWGLKIQI